MNSPRFGENSKKSPNPSFQLVILSVREITPGPATSLHNLWRGGHGIGVGQWEDGGKAVIPPQKEVGSTKAQQDQVLLLCGEKSTTPFPSSPWENPCLPWKASGPHREGSRSRRVRPCIPTGNLCSHPLPTVPMLNLPVDFLFLQPLHHPRGSGSTKWCRGCRWAQKKKKTFLGWKNPELAVGSWDSTEGQPPPSLRAQKLPQSCWQRLRCQRSRRAAPAAPAPAAWGQGWCEQSPGNGSVPEQGMAAPQTPQLNPSTAD